MKPNRFTRALRLGLRMCLFAAVLLNLLAAEAIHAAPVSQPSNAVDAARDLSSAPALQFSSDGYLLGFKPHGMYVVGGSSVLHVDFLGANAVQPRAGSSGDLYGKPAPLSRVAYPELWDGVELTYAAEAGSLYTTTYTLAPGADVNAIRLLYDRALSLRKDGSLIIASDAGAMTETAPIAWQDIAGRRVPVQVDFQLHGQSLGFEVGRYDRRYALVIDPSLIWNTFLGGLGHDVSAGIARDGSGNIYVAGNSNAPWTCEGTPCTVMPYAGEGDVFVAKLDPAGTLIWNTFVSSSYIEQALSMAVDTSGNVSVLGLTSYTNAFVARLDASGNLSWKTALAPAENQSGAVAVDASGNTYAMGYSGASWGNPIHPFTYGQGSNAFVAKLDSGGNLTWNTFLGKGSDGIGSGITLDSVGNVYIVGDSKFSWGTPRRSFRGGWSDAFVAKLDPAGQLIWNSFLGGAGTDMGYNIALDAKGNIYVSGMTSFISWGSPIRPLIDMDAFVARLSPGGYLIWNTFLGGAHGADEALGIAVDGGGSIYVSGRSYASWGSPDRGMCGEWDVFAAKLSSAGKLIWNTFLGNCDEDSGGKLAIDARGHMFITGYSRFTWGKPIRAHGGGFYDAFVAKVSAPITQVFRSVGSQDGWVLESSETSGLGGTIKATGTTFTLGDDLSNRQYRGILSFQTGSLPDGARLTNARLTLTSQSVTPLYTDPFKILQGLMVDTRKGYFGSSSGLQPADFRASASIAPVGPFFPVPVGRQYIISLPRTVFPYINKLDTNAGLTQMRLRFRLDDNNDRVANFISFYSGNLATSSYRPTLTITYYVP